MNPTTSSTSPTAAPDAPIDPAPGRGRGRALLVGGIAAALVFTSGGVAVGVAVGAAESDDGSRPSVGTTPPDNDNDILAEIQGVTAASEGPRFGTDSVDALVLIADAARSAAHGNVISLGAKRDGTWEVQLTTPAGDETTVHVDSHLGAAIIATELADGDDRAPAYTLNNETIRAVVSASLRDTPGMVTELNADDDDFSPYDATIITTANRSIEIDLSSSFSAISKNTDD